MVVPLIVWGGVIVAGIASTAWAADEIGDAAEKSERLVKWAVVGGGLYVSYRALRSTGVIK